MQTASDVDFSDLPAAPQPVARTPFGKGIFIKPKPGTSLFTITMDGGGTQPREFDGLWSYLEARNRVQHYIDSGKGREIESVAADIGIPVEQLKEALDAPAADDFADAPPEAGKKTLSLKRK